MDEYVDQKYKTCRIINLVHKMSENDCSNKEQWLEYPLYREQSQQTEEH
jgi:hypothetical protein